MVFLLKHVHGTQAIGLQFVSNFSKLQAFPLPEEMPQIENTPHFLSQVTTLTCSSAVAKTGLGKATSSALTTDETDALKHAGHTVHSPIVR